VQYSEEYVPIKIRSVIYPVAQAGSYLSWILILFGLFMNFSGLVFTGIIAFSAAVLFQLVTLPTEFNASKRAIEGIRSTYSLDEEETKGAKAVLNAAAMTYVAAVIVSLAQLLRLLLIFGGRRRN
jgi:Zn-dependent membrane protease YugP